MIHKINIKARIDRHSRIIKDNIGIKNKISSILYHNKLGYKVVVISMVFIMPIYPVFASFVHKNTEYDFLRTGYIDESSIIDSYIETNTDNSNMYQAKNEFLSVSTVLDDSRDLSGVNEIIKYKVEPGDSIVSIAADFKIHPEHILWANNFDSKHVIKPGDIIKVPPVSGLLHVVKSGETLASISNFYGINADIIRDQNSLDTKGLIAGQTIVIPGARKPKEEPVQVKPVSNQKYTQNNSKSTKNNKNANVTYPAQTGYYTLSSKSSYHSFYWGNCTWYVAKYKNVTWGGDAKAWLANAARAGVPTGNTPTLGSIVVFNGSGYNPRYGHVGIVMKIDGNNMVISDMNYRALGEVTNRKVSLNDRAIRGYIYTK